MNEDLRTRMSAAPRELPIPTPHHAAEPLSPEEEARQQADYHATAGDLRGDDGDFQGALGEYKKAARLDPTSHSKLTQLADGYAAADLPHKALEAYQRALEAAQHNGASAAELTDAHLGLGDLCRTFAHSAAAVRSYERAVRARPRKPFYRWKLAVALAALGLYDQAERQLLTALELSPRDAFYHFQLADVYLLMRRDEAAIEHLRTVVSLAPRDEYYRLRLGAALLRVEKTDEAVLQFERAAEMQPENASYRALLRYAYTRNHQEPPIAFDVEMVDLGAYDENFVRRIQRMSTPIPDGKR